MHLWDMCRNSYTKMVASDRRVGEQAQRRVASGCGRVYSCSGLCVFDETKRNETKRNLYSTKRNETKVYSKKRNCIIDETERGPQIKVSPINSAKWVDCSHCKVAEVTWRLSVLDQDCDTTLWKGFQVNTFDTRCS